MNLSNEPLNTNLYAQVANNQKSFLYFLLLYNYPNICYNPKLGIPRIIRVEFLICLGD